MNKLIPVHVVTPAMVPVACTLDGAGQQGGLEEFRQLFADALVGRERTVEGIRFRFRNDAGIEHRVRDLARREAQCCAFFTFTITVAGGEVLWDGSVHGDHESGVGVLSLFLTLPDTLGVATPVSSAPQSSARAKSAASTIGAVVGVALCAAACAIPVFGAALIGGAEARVLDVPVWGIAVGAALLVGAWTLLRNRRGGATPNGSCGC